MENLSVTGKVDPRCELPKLEKRLKGLFELKTKAIESLVGSILEL